MARLTYACAVILILACALTLVAQTVYPTGTTIYNPDRTWNGYTVLSPLQTQAVIVIDMNGNVVKRWDGYNNSAGGPARIFPDGVVMAASGANVRRIRNPSSSSSATSKAMSYGGLATANKSKPRRQHGLVGASASRLAAGRLSGRLLLTGLKAFDHRQQYADSDPYEPQPAECRRRAARRRSPHRGLVGRRNRLGVGCERPHRRTRLRRRRKQVRSNPRRASMLRGAVSTGCTSTRRPMSGRTTGSTKAISGSPRTTSSSAAGRPAFSPSLAGTARSSGGSVRTSAQSKELRAIRQIIGQHHAHIIPKGLPGAGNLLVFDNGGASGYGFTNPNAPTARTPLRAQLRACSKSTPLRSSSFGPLRAPGFTAQTSVARKDWLNGNTLITEGASGRLFEVTKEGKIVWEYIYPVVQRCAVYRILFTADTACRTTGFHNSRTRPSGPSRRPRLVNSECPKATKKSPSAYGISNAGSHRYQSERHRSGHHDVWRTEYRSRRACADRLRAGPGRQPDRHGGNVLGAAARGNLRFDRAHYRHLAQEERQARQHRVVHQSGGADARFAGWTTCAEAKTRWIARTFSPPSNPVCSVCKPTTSTFTSCIGRIAPPISLASWAIGTRRTKTPCPSKRHWM